MKKLFYSIVLTLTMLATTSCSKIVVGKGDIIKETRTVGTYDKIHLDMNADVVLVKSNFKDIDIEAESNIIKKVITKIVNNELIITTENNTLLIPKTKTKLTLFVPNISQLNVTSSGKIYSIDTFLCTNLILNLDGSGEIDVRANVANLLSVDKDGSGKIIVSGNTQLANYKQDGSGCLAAFSMKSNVTNAVKNGSGKIETTTISNLNAVINGSGNIYYKGNPLIVKNKNGSGNLINAN
ncbi:MAG: DUF2807 domain-containing protein [Ferruginibacter sp.]|nr:DUF2807 domain-containing protein [Ferruginibacter sp.]